MLGGQGRLLCTMCSSSGVSDGVRLVSSKVGVGSDPSDIVRALSDDPGCKTLRVTHPILEALLRRFKDDWKSSFGVFQWAWGCCLRPSPSACASMIDILGKTGQFHVMSCVLHQLNTHHLLTLPTISKAMRRLSAAGLWEEAVLLFDNLPDFGFHKDTHSMNLLLDTLCKEGMVDRARHIFFQLNSHIPPNAHTFNIFIHGWCKVHAADEAYWTLQEMKSHGCRPCVITYSTIIHFYCLRRNFVKVYDLLHEMDAQACPPNVFTFTAILCSLTKSHQYHQALTIPLRMNSVGCKPDTLFYNAFIHALGRAGNHKEALRVFEEDMPTNAVPPNTSTYNTMIAMYCRDHQQDKALILLQELEASNLCGPDVQSYYPLFKSCFRTGKVDTLLPQLLSDMVNKHHLSLDKSAYTLLIHGLCRAEKCEWAYRLFHEMIGQDIKPRYQTCRLLLEEVRSNFMREAADRIDLFMKKL